MIYLNCVKLMRTLKLSLSALFLFWIFLYFSGKQILIKESVVEKNAVFPETVSAQIGLINRDEAAFVCTYFNGRAILHRVYRPKMSANNDACPTWLNFHD